MAKVTKESEIKKTQHKNNKIIGEKTIQQNSD